MKCDFEYCMKQNCNSCKKQKECDINEHSINNKQVTNRNKTKRKKRKARHKNVLFRKSE